PHERGERAVPEHDRIAGAPEGPRLGGIAVDPHVSLNGAHALLRGSLRERAPKRCGQADSGGQGEQRAAALNVHAGKSTLTKLPAVRSCPIASRRKPAPISSSTRGIPSTGTPGERKRSNGRERRTSRSSSRSDTPPATGAT